MNAFRRFRKASASVLSISPGYGSRMPGCGSRMDSSAFFLINSFNMFDIFVFKRRYHVEALKKKAEGSSLNSTSVSHIQARLKERLLMLSEIVERHLWAFGTSSIEQKERTAKSNNTEDSYRFYSKINS
eukprot:Awhi_evm1s5769